MSQRFGITSVQETSANTIYLQALRDLAREGRLNMEIFPHIVHAPETFVSEPQESLHHLIDVADTFRSQGAKRYQKDYRAKSSTGGKDINSTVTNRKIKMINLALKSREVSSAIQGAPLGSQLAK